MIIFMQMIQEKHTSARYNQHTDKLTSMYTSATIPISVTHLVQNMD